MEGAPVRLTKIGHSCVRLDDGAASLVLDPGMFVDAAAAIAGVHAVLVTHEHPDHVAVDQVRAALDADPDLRVWAPPPVIAALGGADDRRTVVGAGESFEAGGFPVRTYGGQHALIHPLIPVVPNVAYVVGDAVLHPGDSFTVPDRPVQVALVPIHAPWSKAAEVIDFAVSVRAPRSFAIHDGLINAAGLGLVETHLTRITAPHGSTYAHWEPGDSVEV
jgi:L-ascorbate metabolism protein UlaG (beta-lactamase superfamily)